MRNNVSALRHPTIQRKIRHAIWLAKLEAMRNYKADKHKLFNRGKQYVQNRHGHNIMRVDWNISVAGQQWLTVWGDQSRNITAMVKEALGI